MKCGGSTYKGFTSSSKYLCNNCNFVIEKKNCVICNKKFDIKFLLNLDFTKRKNGIKTCSRKCANSIGGLSNKGKLKIKNCYNCGHEIILKNNAFFKNIKCENCIVYDKKHCKWCGCNPCNSINVCGKNNMFQHLNKYFGFNLDTIGTIAIENEFNKIKNLLYNYYYIKNLTLQEICDILGYKFSSHLGKIFNLFNIKRRNFKESNLNFMLSGKSYNYKKINFNTGIIYNWNTKEPLFYRSSYEFEYIKYLNLNKIRYIYEKIRIQYYDSQIKRNRISIPDFYLIDTNTIVEIKSFYTLKNHLFKNINGIIIKKSGFQNMYDKITEYIKLGYNVRLIVDKNYIYNNKKILIYLKKYL